MRAWPLIAIASLTGCAAIAHFDPPAGVPYAPLEVSIGQRPPAVLEASRRALRQLGFVVSVESDAGLEATRGGEDGTRDRAQVSAAGNRLSIDLRTEIQDADGQWLRADHVCWSYRHVRERALAAAIARELAAPQPSSG